MSKPLIKGNFFAAQEARLHQAQEKGVDKKKKEYAAMAYQERYLIADRYNVYDSKVGFLYRGEIISMGPATFRIKFMQSNGKNAEIGVVKGRTTTMNKRYYVWKLGEQKPSDCPM
jgi:hypothetical protein